MPHAHPSKTKPTTGPTFEKSPPGYEAVHEDGLRSMVDVEDDGTRHARQVVQAVVGLYLLRGKRTPLEIARAAATSSELLREGLSGSFLMTRQAASAAGGRLFSAEMKVVTKDARRAGVAITEEERARQGIEASRKALEDLAVTPYRGAIADAASVKRADAAADGYIKVWRSKLDDYMESRTRRGSSPGLAVEDATAAADHKIVTAVATETSEAFNTAHAEHVKAVIRKADAQAVKSMYLRWDAVLDERTCSTCSDMHGRVVPAKEGFPGDQPGSVHPRCRCQSQLIWLPN